MSAYILQFMFIFLKWTFFKFGFWQRKIKKTFDCSSTINPTSYITRLRALSIKRSPSCWCSLISIFSHKKNSLIRSLQCFISSIQVKPWHIRTWNQNEPLHFSITLRDASFDVNSKHICPFLCHFTKIGIRWGEQLQNIIGTGHELIFLPGFLVMTLLSHWLSLSRH